MAVHSTICLPYLTHYGTVEHQEQYVPLMTAGECAASVGMTEPDLQGIRTNAKRDGDDWISNGSKIYINNGLVTTVPLDKENAGFYQLMEQLPQERLMIAVHSEIMLTSFTPRGTWTVG